ncbi:elongation factor P [Candidatus Falkowbacteria bacterium]|nr:MAG: elongation factor P [Candidatus Falkowbacteria bacterium]
MLSISEIKIGKVIAVNGEPYIVLKTDHHKMGRGGAVLKVKLKNLVTSAVLDKTFQGNDKAEEAGVEKKKANFMYKDEDNANFMDNENYEQFTISLEVIGEKKKFLRDNTDVDVLYFRDKPVAIDLPVKMKFRVVEAPPGIKGNSAGNVTKRIKIETGAEINAPLFINEGDEIMVNIEKEEYAERA